MRDGVRRFLHSLVRGKLHYFIRFCFLVAFLFLTFRVSVVAVNYYLDRLKGYGVSIQNPRFRIGKKLVFSFDGVDYKSDSVEFHGGSGEVVVDLLDSFKEGRPVVYRASLGSFYASVSGGRGGGRITVPDISSLPLRLVVRNLHLGAGSVRSRDYFFDFKGLDWGDGKFLLRGVDGRIKGKRFKLSQIKGVVLNDRVKTAPFSLSGDSFYLNGTADFSLDFYFLDFRGAASFPDGKVAVYLVKNGNSASASGKAFLKTLRKRFKFRIAAAVDGEVDFRGTIFGEGEPFKLTFNGVFDGEDFSLKGDADGDFSVYDYAVKGGDVGFMFSGRAGSVDGSVRGKVKKFLVGKRSFENLKFSAGLNDSRRLNLVVEWRDGNRGKLEVTGDLSKRDFFVKAAVKGFDLKADPLVVSLSPSVREWIPEAIGNLSLKAEIKKGKPTAVNLSFLMTQFEFRGFAGKGRLFLKSVAGKFPVSLKISGSDGTLAFNGFFNPSAFSVDGSVAYKNLRLDAFDFLSSQGIKGAITGNGRIYGKLTSLRGNFRYRASRLSYFDERFSEVTGVINLDYPSLFVTAKDAAGKLNLKRLALRFSPAFSVAVDASVKGFHLAKVEKVAGHYGVSVPVKLEGTADGNVSLSFSRGRKVPFKMKVVLARYDAFYSVDRVVRGNAVGRGTVAFDGKLNIELSGKSEDAETAGLRFKGGTYRLTLDGDILNVSGEGFSSSLFDRSSGKFSLTINTASRTLNGRFSLNGSKAVPRLVTKIALQGKIKGFFDNFTVPVKGSVSISSEFLKGGISAAFSGVLHEPDNAGEIAFHTDRGSVYAIIDGKDLTLKGTLKDLDFVFNRIKVAAGMVVLNLSVRDFNFKRISGVVGVPVLAVLPGGKFPEIDAVSGVYAEFKNGAVAVKDASFSFPGGWFTVNLSFADGVVDGDFKGFLSVKTLARKFLPSVLVKEGEAAVSGTFRYDEGFTYSVSVDSENVVGRVDYLLGTVKIDKFSLKFQNGRLRSVFAAVEVEDGNILISGGDVITASIFNLPVGQRGFWRARVTGNLRFTGKELAGNVNVSRPVILKLSAGKKKRTDAGISIPFNVDIDVNFLEPLEFKTDLWSIKLLPVLKVTVINGLPVISGNFFVLDGKINYMGKEFVISYGSGIVDNLVELKGNVNIAASSKIGDYYVYMFVRGTLASPVLYFSSEPPLTKEEILSLIMTGATPSEMERSNELFPVVQVAYYATSTLLKPVEKTFSKLFKLESFSVEPYITRYGETVIKLSVAKRIGDRLRLIGYQTTGQDPEFSVGAQYFVGHYKNVYLEYQYSNYYHNEYGVGFNFKVKDWIWLKEKVKRKLKKLTQ